MNLTHRTRVILRTLGILLIFGVFGPVSHASIPMTIGYQGFLADPNGSPIESEVAIQFALYDASDAPSALWAETLSVTPTAGRFAVTLGQSTPLVAELFRQALFIGITVGQDSEMSPRLPLNSVPFAFRAGATFDNVVFVPLASTAVASGEALVSALASITDASASNPYVVQLDAGTYDAGDAAVSVPSFVALQGANAASTTIISNADQAVSLEDHAALRSLTVSAHPAPEAGVDLVAAVSTMSAIELVDLVVIIAPANGEAASSVGVDMAGDQQLLRNVAITVSGGSEMMQGLRATASGLDETIKIRGLEVAVENATGGVSGAELTGYDIDAHGIEISVVDGVGTDMPRRGLRGLFVQFATGKISRFSFSSDQTMADVGDHFALFSFNSTGLIVDDFRINVRDELTTNQVVGVVNNIPDLSPFITHPNQFINGVIEVSSKQNRLGGAFGFIGGGVVRGTTASMTVSEIYTGPGSEVRSTILVIPGRSQPLTTIRIENSRLEARADFPVASARVLTLMDGDAEVTNSSLTAGSILVGQIDPPVNQTRLVSANLIIRNSVVLSDQTMILGGANTLNVQLSTLSGTVLGSATCSGVVDGNGNFLTNSCP